jgi:hypothetical protein
MGFFLGAVFFHQKPYHIKCLNRCRSMRWNWQIKSKKNPQIGGVLFVLFFKLLRIFFRLLFSL